MNERLKKSIESYRAIIDHSRKLEVLLKKEDHQQLEQYTARLHVLQEEAGLNDSDLLAEIAHDSARWQSHPLFRKRMQLLEQIVEMNNLLLPRIHGMMSVTAADLVQLKEGRAAFSGYHPGAGRPKKSIRGVG